MAKFNLTILSTRYSNVVTERILDYPTKGMAREYADILLEGINLIPNTKYRYTLTRTRKTTYVCTLVTKFATYSSTSVESAEMAEKYAKIKAEGSPVHAIFHNSFEE